MASGFPLLNIVLFNTGGDKEVGAGDRYVCMDKILDTILAENYPNLFILAQDEINGPKHQKLCTKLNLDHKSILYKEKGAVVYFNNDTNTHYNVQDVDVGDLQGLHKVLGHEGDNDFTVARLTACVLTPKADIEMGKILLASWHGPWTGLNLQARQTCFNRLIRFLERLKVLKDCGMVIVGGDFNLGAGEADEELNTHKKADEEKFDITKLNGKVLACYTSTDDRPDGDPIDYVVYWPRDGLEDIEISVLRRDLRGEDKKRPFDHCIVVYRFGDRFSDLARQFANMTVCDDEEESDNAKDEEESDDAEDEEGSDNAEDEEGSNIAEDEEGSDNAEDEEGSDIAEDEEGSDIAEDEEGSDDAAD